MYQHSQPQLGASASAAHQFAHYQAASSNPSQFQCNPQAEVMYEPQHSGQHPHAHPHQHQALQVSLDVCGSHWAHQASQQQQLDSAPGQQQQPPAGSYLSQPQASGYAHQANHEAGQQQNYYAMINALNGYQQQSQLDHSHVHPAYDTGSMVAAVAAANSLAAAQHYRQLDLASPSSHPSIAEHHYPHQTQAQAQFNSQQAYASGLGEAKSQYSWFPRSASLSSTSPSSSSNQTSASSLKHQELGSQSQPNPSSNQNANQNQNPNPNSATSAINQLQAFALSTPEAAAAAAAAAASFTPYYATQGAAMARMGALGAHSASPSGVHGSLGPGAKLALAKSQPHRQRASQAKKSGAASKRAASQLDGQPNSNTGDSDRSTAGSNSLTGAKSNSRSQRRYAGRASCVCPNCLHLEKLRQSGLEPPAGENGEPEKKLKHVCHHPGCGKDYDKTSHLRAHLRWHNSERISACRHSHCGKQFSRTDELRKHMKLHHSQTPNGNSNNSMEQHKANLVAAANGQASK